MISTRRRYDGNKDRQSDIDEAKRQGEEYHREVNRRGEKIATRRRRRQSRKGHVH